MQECWHVCCCKSLLCSAPLICVHAMLKDASYFLFHLYIFPFPIFLCFPNLRPEYCFIWHRPVSSSSSFVSVDVNFFLVVTSTCDYGARAWPDSGRARRRMFCACLLQAGHDLMPSVCQNDGAHQANYFLGPLGQGSFSVVPAEERLA